MLAMTDNHPTHSAPALTIDARGLACPLPVLKLRKALESQPPGAVVALLATDRTAARDVPVFCARMGHGLLGISQAEGVFRFLVRRGRGGPQGTVVVQS
jgi:tRNA 2-thiouridine synthesizing protein A